MEQECRPRFNNCIDFNFYINVNFIIVIKITI